MIDSDSLAYGLAMRRAVAKAKAQGLVIWWAKWCDGRLEWLGRPARGAEPAVQIASEAEGTAIRAANVQSVVERQQAERERRERRKVSRGLQGNLL